MTIKEQLMADMKTAMKQREKGRTALDTIRLVRAHIRQAEIDGGHADFDDEQVIAILRKEMKQREETLEEIKDSGRDDLIQETKAEMAVLQKYLPPEMSEEEIEKVVKDTVASLDDSQKKMGPVMKAVMARLKGKADGRKISQIVRKVLA